MRRVRFRNNLILGTSVIAASLFAGAYGRKAEAQCTPQGGGSYQCAGVSTGIFIYASDATLVNPVNDPLTINEAFGDGLGVGGSGAISFSGYNSATSITSTGDDGLDIRSYGDTGNAGSVTVNANGTFYGNQNGINAVNYGSGGTNITVTGDVTGANQDGIFAANVYGEGIIINADDDGQGPVAFIGDGPADGTYVNVTTGPGTVTGGYNGIHVVNNGTGGVNISSSGDVYGYGNHGINAYNSSYDTTSSMFIYRAPGTVSYGVVNGINALNYAGSLTVTALGTAIGNTYNGIYARNNYNAGNPGGLTVTANNAYGGNGGVDARNSGIGALSITTTGTVSGTNFDGIFALNNPAGTSLTVITGPGSVTGGNDGIDARNYGTGGLTISGTGNVYGFGGDGIFAYNSANDTTSSMFIYRAPGSYTYGAVNGINAINNAGSLTITALGTAVGGAGNGINAINNYNAGNIGNLTITANNAYGAVSGIYAINNSASVLSVTTTGTVTGTGSYGIYARQNSANAGDLNVTVNAGSVVTGGNDGIDTNNYAGIGATNILVNGTVSGTATFGIDADDGATAGPMTITTGVNSSVTGGFGGIEATHIGNGALTVNAAGAVTGYTGNGIFAYNGTNGTSLSVTTGPGPVSGGTNGIFADNNGTGGLTITGTGNVYGFGGDGIYANNSANDTTSSMYIYRAPGSYTYGAVNGINAINNAGSLTITALGTAVGGAGDGIFGQNNYNALNLGNLTITAYNATGAQHGVNADNNTIGSLSVTTTGAITGTAADGIQANNNGNGINLSVTVNSTSVVNGGADGIDADNNGTGTTLITVNGSVTGTGGDGIDADDGAATTAMTVITGAGSSVIGSNDGINANHDGTGALTITTGGIVTGQSSEGIFADNSTTGTNLAITVNGGSTVTGSTEGIDANQNGTGTSTIVITGAVNGGTGEGIDFDDAAGSGAASITVNAGGSITSAGDDGIGSDADGVGNHTVTVFGSVIGDNDGLDLDKDGTGNISVYTGVGSYIRGVSNEGVETDISTAGGTTSITVNGTVVAGEEGIEADDAAASGAMTITTGAYSAITAGLDGIEADADGVGDLTVTVNGSVIGGDDGVDLDKDGTGNLSVTTAVGSYVGSTGSEGIETDISTAGGTTSITVNGAVVAAQEGIEADDAGVSGAMTINTGAYSSVTGGYNGIHADHDGTGALTITASGPVTGTAYDGVYANNSGHRHIAVGYDRPRCRVGRREWHQCPQLWHRWADHHWRRECLRQYRRRHLRLQQCE